VPMRVGAEVQALSWRADLIVASMRVRVITSFLYGPFTVCRAGQWRPCGRRQRSAPGWGRRGSSTTRYRIGAGRRFFYMEQPFGWLAVGFDSGRSHLLSKWQQKQTMWPQRTQYSRRGPWE
jgi:hypothetical protein